MTQLVENCGNLGYFLCGCRKPLFWEISHYCKISYQMDYKYKIMRNKTFIYFLVPYTQVSPDLLNKCQVQILHSFSPYGILIHT